MGLHIILPCSLALLVRCSFRAFLVSFASFKLLSLAIAPGAHTIGRWLLDANRGLDELWRFVFHLPILAPIGYGRYLLFGSLVLSLVTAIPVFLLVRDLAKRYRSSLIKRVSGWRVSRWLKRWRGIGILRWAFAGGGAKYDTKTAPRGLLRVVRREMLIGLPAAYLLCYLLAAVIVPFFAGTLATSTASWIVGSDISVSGSAFSLFTGRLTLADLSIQDPRARSENLAEIPSITLDASMTPLLEKHIVFDSVVIADVSLHVAREEDGTLNIDNVSSGWNTEGYIEWAAEHAKNVDWLGLLRQFLRFLSDARPLAPREDPYARYRGGRSFPDFRPPFTVRRLEVGRVLISLEDRFDPGGPLPPITLIEVEICNLAFPAELRERPIELRLRGRFADDPESGFEFSARFEEQDEPLSVFEVSMTRIDLARIAKFYQTTLPVDVLSARATMTAEIRLVGDSASGAITLLLEDLEIAARPDRPLFGLPVETSDRVVQGLNRYADELPIVIAFPVGGTAETPALEWEAPLLEVARDGLLMLGQRRLESTIEGLSQKIDVSGGASATLSPEIGRLQDDTRRAAVDAITGAGGRLLPEEEALLPDVLPWDAGGTETFPTQTDPGALSDLLIEQVLQPKTTTETDD